MHQDSRQIDPEALKQVLENTAAYPVMVTDASAPGAARTGPVDETQRIVDAALRAVLGGRTRVDDPQGLKSALARSFIEEQVDGRRVYRNVPRGSIADTIGEGEVSGFQGALMAHARDVVDHGLPLLDALKSLVPTVDENDVTARASVVRSNVINLRDEFGRRDGPRPPVIMEKLHNLLGTRPTTEPDEVEGAVGRLRDDLGLTGGLNANNIEDEHQLTNYRLLAEYVVGLRTAWETASPIFGAGKGPAYLSALMRHVELMMQTIIESIYQVRTALDSVFLGEAERKIQTIPLPEDLYSGGMTIEEILEWAEVTVSPDSITLIREGGRIAIADSLLPSTQKVKGALKALVGEAEGDLGGLGAPRVKASLRDLHTQWNNLEVRLENLAQQSVRVPDTRGKELRVAREVLQRKGLEVEPSSSALDSYIVLSSDPEPCQLVRPHQIVRLTVKDCPPRETPYVATGHGPTEPDDNSGPGFGPTAPSPNPPDNNALHLNTDPEAFWRPVLDGLESLMHRFATALDEERARPRMQDRADAQSDSTTSSPATHPVSTSGPMTFEESGSEATIDKDVSGAPSNDADDSGARPDDEGDGMDNLPEGSPSTATSAELGADGPPVGHVKSAPSPPIVSDPDETDTAGEHGKKKPNRAPRGSTSKNHHTPTPEELFGDAESAPSTRDEPGKNEGGSS